MSDHPSSRPPRPALQKNSTPARVRRFNLFVALGVGFATLAYALFKWANFQFGRPLDLEAIIFTLMLPKGGAGRDVLFSFLALAALALPLSAALAWGWYRLLARLSRPTGERKAFISRPAGFAYLFLVVVGLFHLGGAFYYLEHRKQVFSFFLKPRAATTLYDEYYRSVDPDQVTFAARRNVILLMLESAEDTYNQEKVFGEKLMPGLDRLRRENLSFHGMEETRGATLTVGGLAAYTFGLPLAFSQAAVLNQVYGESMDRFMPGARSILTIFERHGYDIEFMLGSDQAFAGQDKLFTTHCAAKIYGYQYFDRLRKKGELQFERSNWGMPDVALYDQVKTHLSARRSDRPFFLVVQTIDTHAVKGHGNGLRPRKWGDLRDRFVEADLMASDFVAWAQKQPFAPDTTIIVLGDHLLPLDEIGPLNLPDRAGREIYNVFINPVPPPPADRPRHFASFDLAPTILESAGARLPEGRLGLGVSLFKPDRQTLFELKGRTWYDEEVRKKSTLYDSFLLPKALPLPQ